MPRKNAQVRRTELLDAAIEQIRLHGMGSVRIADIAKALGVSPALIMYHFESKDRLLVETLIHAAERDLATLGRIIRGTGSPAERLIEALEWYGPTDDARGWQLWIDAWSASQRDPNLAAVLDDLQVRWIESIAGVITQGVTGGDFSTSDAEGVATRLTALLDGLAVRSLLNPSRLPKATVRAWVAAQVRAELGIAAKPAT